uniref:Uncharacterized protein n=1 Tax=Salix viminalis TaxID=40686 RepID=A0A6N2KJ96_SALVM
MYVDALTIMVSEMETENGYKPKNVQGEMQENTGKQTRLLFVRGLGTVCLRKFHVVFARGDFSFLE